MAERSSAARVAGVVIRNVTVGSQTYCLSQPDKVRKAADEEAVIMSLRKIPPGLSGEDRAAAAAALVCGIASPGEWTAYYQSPWFMAFRFWSALDPSDRRQHAGVTGRTPGEMLRGVNWAFETIQADDATREQLDDLWMNIRMVSQEEQVGNSLGSPQVEGTPATDTRSSEVGPQSTSSS